MDSGNCSSSSKCQENGESVVDSIDELPISTNSNLDSLISCSEDNHFDFESLPHVVLLTILSYLQLKELGRTACVSKYLNSCCSYPGLWTIVNLSNRKHVDDSVLKRIVHISKNITTLDISEAVSITEYGLRSALQECSTLVEFKAVRCSYVSNECLQVIGEKCVGLRVIDLSICKITDDGIDQLCQGCTSLEQIKLNHCIQLTSQSLKHIANHCSSLKHLSIENNVFMHDDGVGELVSKCTQLQRLQLNSCGITGQSVNKIAMHSHAMSILDVRYCASLDDEMVQKLVFNCKNLVILNLSLCFRVTDVSVAYICQYCTRLKSVYLVHCNITDKGLVTLSSSSFGIQWIDVSWCQKITDEGVRALLKGCNTLEHLGIVRCDLVTNETIHELCLQYPSVYISSFITEMDRFLKKADSNSNTNQPVQQ